jgi:hypothetical protein
MLPCIVLQGFFFVFESTSLDRRCVIWRDIKHKREKKNHSYFTLQKAFSCRHPTRKWWQLTTNNKKTIWRKGDSPVQMDIRLSFSIGSRASSETHSYKDDDASHPAWSGDIGKCWVKPRAMGFMEHKDLHWFVWWYLEGTHWVLWEKNKNKSGSFRIFEMPPPPKQRRENMVPRFRV